MKKILILIVSITVLLSCSNDNDKVPSEVNIRISNISEFNYQNIVVNASIENVNVKMDIENLNSGQMTEYKRFETAHPYPYIELQIEGETYNILPLTTGFDVPLENGNYTYQINANDSPEQYDKLSFQLIQE